MSKLVKLCFVFLALMSVSTFGATIAYWDFEDGVAGEPFTDSAAGEADGSGGTVDSVGGYLMRGWSDYYGPSFVSNTELPGSSVGMRNADSHQDGYCTDEALTTWSSSTWTIECSVSLKELNGWKTIIGRDGSSQGEAEADFYLQNNGIDNKFRLNFDTVGGQRWVLDGDYTLQANYWYGLAVQSDGETVTMLIDDGSGYQVVGSLDISEDSLEGNGQSIADNALAFTNYTWTFGRGWYNGGFVDHINGYMDNIRISDTVLAPEELIAVPEPATVGLLTLGGLLLRRRR